MYCLERLRASRVSMMSCVLDFKLRQNESVSIISIELEPIRTLLRRVMPPGCQNASELGHASLPSCMSVCLRVTLSRAACRCFSQHCTRVTGIKSFKPITPHAKPPAFCSSRQEIAKRTCCCRVECPICHTPWVSLHPCLRIVGCADPPVDSLWAARGKKKKRRKRTSSARQAPPTLLASTNTACFEAVFIPPATSPSSCKRVEAISGPRGSGFDPSRRSNSETSCRSSPQGSQVVGGGVVRPGPH